MGLLTDRINNKLEKSNLINEHAHNREPVPLTLLSSICIICLRQLPVPTSTSAINTAEGK